MHIRVTRPHVAKGALLQGDWDNSSSKILTLHVEILTSRPNIPLIMKHVNKANQGRLNSFLSKSIGANTFPYDYTFIVCFLLNNDTFILYYNVALLLNIHISNSAAPPK